jgi:hypothetical protein
LKLMPLNYLFKMMICLFFNKAASLSALETGLVKTN